MGSVLEDLATNLKGGVLLCLFRKLTLAQFRVSADQMAALFLFGLLVSLISGYFINLPNPEFNSYALTAEGFSFTALLFSAYLVGRLVLHRDTVAAFSVLALSVGPPTLVAWLVIESVLLADLDNATVYLWVYAGYVLWVLAVILWCLRTLAGGMSRRVAGSFVLSLFTWVMPVWYLAGSTTFWYPGDSDDETDSYAAYRNLNAERLLFSQPAMLDQALQALEPGRDGVTDAYFIGVGAYATQDVFLKETLFARDLFDRRFDTAGRSLALINHLTTRDELPLATSTNLEAALRRIGSVMNRDEDVLVLYMTSHGSSDHELSMSFWPLPLNDVTPEMLRQYLDDAGIKWRVVIISACYSGGFIDRLRSPDTAIATAAAPDRTSFGCSNENDFTYFGEALLKDQLQQEYSLPVAFSRAAEAVAARESREKLDASNPQFFIGENISPVLDALTRELKAHAASDSLAANPSGADETAWRTGSENALRRY